MHPITGAVANGLINILEKRSSFCEILMRMIIHPETDLERENSHSISGRRSL
jgi:hypothetical protein